MKLSGKILPLLLMLVLVLSAGPALALAEDAADVDTAPDAVAGKDITTEDDAPDIPLPNDKTDYPLLPEVDAATAQGQPAPAPTMPPDPDNIKSLAIKDAPSRLAAGKSRQLRAEVRNYRHQIIDKDVAWMSNNSRVLTVSPTTGIIRAKNPGTATIIARTMTQSGVMRATATIEVVSRNNDIKILSGGRYYATYMWEYCRTNNSEDPPIAALAPPINLRNTWRALRPIPYTTKTYFTLNGQVIDSALIAPMGWDRNGKLTTVDFESGGTYLFRFEYSYMDGVDEVAGHAYYKLHIPPH